MVVEWRLSAVKCVNGWKAAKTPITSYENKEKTQKSRVWYAFVWDDYIVWVKKKRRSKEEKEEEEKKISEQNNKQNTKNFKYQDYYNRGKSFGCKKLSQNV